MSSGAPGKADPPVLEPMCSIFRRFLKRQGLKFTPERAVVLDTVLGKSGVFEADELLFDIRKRDRRVSKATIYRTLKHLLECRILTEVLIDSKQAHYQLSFGQTPHGHLVCLESNRILEFDYPELEQIRDRICREHGYQPVTSRLVIYGISPQARAEGQTRPAGGQTGRHEAAR